MQQSLKASRGQTGDAGNAISIEENGGGDLTGCLPAGQHDK